MPRFSHGKYLCEEILFFVFLLAKQLKGCLPTRVDFAKAGVDQRWVVNIGCLGKALLQVRGVWGTSTSTLRRWELIISLSIGGYAFTPHLAGLLGAKSTVRTVVVCCSGARSPLEYRLRSPKQPMWKRRQDQETPNEVINAIIPSNSSPRI